MNKFLSWICNALRVKTERDNINEWCDRMANIDQEAERALEMAERRKVRREQVNQSRRDRQQRRIAQETQS